MSEATVIAPDGTFKTGSLFGEGAGEAFNYENSKASPGTYTLNFNVTGEYSSGSLLGNINVSDQSGNIIEHFDILAP